MINNNRQELRLNKDETVFIETYTAHPNDKENSKMLICHSVDVSANGLKAIVDEQLPIDAIYQICVELNETGERIFLVGQIKWQTEIQEDGGYAIGILIFESDDTDIEQWKRYIAAQLESSVSFDR